MNEYIIAFIVVIIYFFLGAIINGLMHRYDPRTFDCSTTQVAIVVFWWPFVIPIYWFCVFADRCVVWFEKKK